MIDFRCTASNDEDFENNVRTKEKDSYDTDTSSIVSNCTISRVPIGLDNNVFGFQRHLEKSCKSVSLFLEMTKSLAPVGLDETTKPS